MSSTELLKKVTITLTDDQIKALPSSPIEIVSALGSGKAIRLISATLSLNVVNAYGNVNPDWSALYLAYDAAGGYAAGLPLKSNTFLQAVNPVALVEPDVIYVAGENYNRTTVLAKESLDNKSLLLTADNGDSGNFTIGDVANALKVTVFYVEVDL